MSRKIMDLFFKATNSRTVPSDPVFDIKPTPLPQEGIGRHSYHTYQYRATQHSTTKISPFEALTRRKMNIVVPSILHPQTSIPIHFRMTANDTSSKAMMKTYADQIR